MANLTEDQKQFWNILRQPYTKSCGTCLYKIDTNCTVRYPKRIFTVYDFQGWGCDSYIWKDKI